MTGVRARLSTMMFLQYFIWGVWFVTMGTYLGQTLAYGRQSGLATARRRAPTLGVALLMGVSADRLLLEREALGRAHWWGVVM